MHNLKCWLILASELLCNVASLGDCWWEESYMVFSFFRNDYDRTITCAMTFDQNARHEAFEEYGERRRYDVDGKDARAVVKRLADAAGVPPCDTFRALLNGYGRMLTLFRIARGRQPANWQEFEAFLNKE